jgi:serine/threonine protein kinase
MSPEQARGDDELDARVDIYALGVIMYEAATGRVPFIGNNYLSVISQVLNEEPRLPRELRSELSEEFEAIVMRAMDKDRALRYASAQELLADLTALLDDPTRSTERAKITGPRRKAAARSKSPLKIAIWVALVAVVIAAVVTTVVMLFGGAAVIKDKKKAIAPPVPAPVVVDAAIPPPPPDAPEAPTLEITIVTDPPGATIQQDGVDKGSSPLTTKVVIGSNHYTEFVASEPGYEDKKIAINALVDKNTRYKMVLKKLPRDTAPVHPPSGRPVDHKRPPDDKPQNRTGGEFNGNPFKTGSNAAAPRP